MKITIKKFFIIIILNFGFISHLYSDDQKSELNKLFEKLKVENASLSFETEQKIWKIWSTHPIDTELTSMLTDGSDFVNDNQ